jgi:radical SAM additional 4Fe4S-binding domain
MSFETAKSILGKEMSMDDGYEEVAIDFFGGEPFTEFELIEDCVEYLLENRWNKKLICFASTNGTLIHNKIKDWLALHKDYFWAGLSIDGTKEMHDKNRSNSFDSIDVKFFKDMWPTQPVKMTISKETLPDLSKGIIYLHELGFDLFSNLAVGIDWSAQENVEILQRELLKLIDYYVSNPTVKVCSLLDRSIETLALPKTETFRWCGVGTHMTTYDIHGAAYPCHFFMPLSLGEQGAEQAKNLNFSMTQKLYDEECENCMILNICPSCYGSAYQQFGDIRKRDPNMCRLNKIISKASAFLLWKKIEILGIETVAKDLGCAERTLVDSILMLQDLQV